MVHPRQGPGWRLTPGGWAARPVPCTFLGCSPGSWGPQAAPHRARAPLPGLTHARATSSCRAAWPPVPGGEGPRPRGQAEWWWEGRPPPPHLFAAVTAFPAGVPPGPLGWASEGPERPAFIPGAGAGGGLAHVAFVGRSPGSCRP